MDRYGYQPIRTTKVPLFIAGALAVIAGRATFSPMRKLLVLNTEFALGVVETGAGNTTVAIKKNGNLIGGATDLSIPEESGTKFVKAKPSVGIVGGEPSGVMIDVGDTITVDVTAVPATTPGTDAAIYLHCAEIDV